MEISVSKPKGGEKKKKNDRRENRCQRPQMSPTQRDEDRNGVKAVGPRFISEEEPGKEAAFTVTNIRAGNKSRERRIMAVGGKGTNQRGGGEKRGEKTDEAWKPNTKNRQKGVLRGQKGTHLLISFKNRAGGTFTRRSNKNNGRREERCRGAARRVAKDVRRTSEVGML